MTDGPVHDDPTGGVRPLQGRVAVVTGVSRRAGIGFAIARRLLADGASVLLQSWAAHDADQVWGAEPGGVDALVEELRAGGAVEHVTADLADPAAPAAIMGTAVDAFSHVDIVVANHARSSSQDLEHLTADELDASWAVNARATVLLVQAFAAHHDDDRVGGRVVLFTSGQHLGPMGGELPYVMSKGAVHQMTRSLADHLGSRGITVNAVNPGPTDTGWAPPDLHEQVRKAFPSGRWGVPDDAAGLVAWLVSDEGEWITGQVIDSEGGFRRWS